MSVHLTCVRGHIVWVRAAVARARHMGRALCGILILRADPRLQIRRSREMSVFGTRLSIHEWSGVSLAGRHAVGSSSAAGSRPGRARSQVTGSAATMQVTTGYIAAQYALCMPCHTKSRIYQAGSGFPATNCWSGSRHGGAAGMLWHIARALWALISMREWLR